MKGTTNHSEAASGFTLVELLTVIAVIAVLMSILIPTIGKVVQASRRTACASNLRQIQMGMVAYAIANGGWYPVSCTSTADGYGTFYTAEGGLDAFTTGPIAGWKTGIGWLIARQGSLKPFSGNSGGAQPYITNWRVFYCPTAEKKEINASATWWTTDDTVVNGDHSPKTGTRYQSNYGQWNPWTGSPFNGCIAKRMTDSPRFVMTGDKVGWIRGSGRWGIDYRPQNNLIMNHPSGGNFVYNDGHVDFKLINGPADTTGWRCTGTSATSNTAYWYAVPDVK